ncbi:unnamed protein product, partial [marine sediment metagenome]
ARVNVGGDWNINAPLARSKIGSGFRKVYADLIMQFFTKASPPPVAYGPVESN